MQQRKSNANLELQIYHMFAPFANISKSVFSSSENSCGIGNLNFLENFSIGVSSVSSVEKDSHSIQRFLFIYLFIHSHEDRSRLNRLGIFVRD